jgi:hypothetical protein
MPTEVDNYVWIVGDDHEVIIIDHEVIIIDPADADSIAEAVGDRRLTADKLTADG